MKRRSWREWGKWALLGVTVAAIVIAAPSEPGLEEAPAKANAAPPRPLPAGSAPLPAQKKPAADTRVELERYKRPQAPAQADEIPNAFNATSWYVPPPPPPPPPPAPPAPPPKPTAPALPFTYLGTYEDAPVRLVILLNGDRLHTVGEGDVIDNTYRVERVAEGVVELMYLPLNIKQSLRIGAGS